MPLKVRFFALPPDADLQVCYKETLYSRLLPQFAILIATFAGLASVNALIYALLADKLRAKIAKPSVLAWFSRLGGGALIAMGVATAAFKRGQ